MGTRPGPSIFQQIDNRNAENRNRAVPRHVSAPGRHIIIWHPFRTDILYKFRPRTGLVDIFEGVCQNWLQFLREIVSRVGTCVCCHHIFDYSADVLEPPHRLAPRAAARVARPLVRLWFGNSRAGHLHLYSDFERFGTELYSHALCSFLVRG